MRNEPKNSETSVIFNTWSKLDPIIFTLQLVTKGINIHKRTYHIPLWMTLVISEMTP